MMSRSTLRRPSPPIAAGSAGGATSSFLARSTICALALSAAVTLAACSSECRDVPCGPLFIFRTHVDVPSDDTELYATTCRNGECVTNVVPLVATPCGGDGGCPASCSPSGQDAVTCLTGSPNVGWDVYLMYGKQQRLLDSARNGDLYTITIGSQSDAAIYEVSQVAQYTEFDPSNEHCGETICKVVTIEP